MLEVLLYYKYVTLDDPLTEANTQRQLCTDLGLTGRIILAEEGINGTISGAPAATQAYRDYLSAHPAFHDIEYKIDTTDVVIFPRLRVKIRPEIVALGRPVEHRPAPKLTPDQFHQLAADPNVILFDARNNYESAIGRFAGAVTPDIKHFKDLPNALAEYEDLKDRTVVTYCTGGIRCEKASAILRDQGFENVYQLDGGIIKYAQSYPNGRFQGKCFVFDGRMSVAFKPDYEQLAPCHHCGAASSEYRNCAHKPCNLLYTACANCYDERTTCSSKCSSHFVRETV